MKSKQKEPVGSILAAFKTGKTGAVVHNGSVFEVSTALSCCRFHDVSTHENSRIPHDQQKDHAVLCAAVFRNAEFSGAECSVHSTRRTAAVGFDFTPTVLTVMISY